ncbi:MAG: DUF748 domain-containing protein [Candidatus Omnitrophica bacterium]|nr:DUF748 domain-containing protein [Candidatus Omnitrophota bacterium]MCM8793993.1 DUF748 domain-containing protein [Candidatus Omnitrophota bacterium]
MRKVKKIILLCIVLMIITGYFLLRFKLGFLFMLELSKLLKRPVNIEKVDLEFPFSITIKNLVVLEPSSEESDEKFLTVERVKVTPAILPFLKGKVFLYSLTFNHPQLRIVRLSRDKFNFSDIFSPQIKSPNKRIPLLVLKLKIVDGEIIFIDKTVSEPREIYLKDIDFLLSKLIFPLTDVAMDYKLRAETRGGDVQETAEINSSGWLNFKRKDMDVKFSLRNLDYLNIKPYLKEVISGKINQGIINFYTEAVSQNNDLSLKCRLELEKIATGASSFEIFGIPLEKIMEAFKDKDGKIMFDFEIKTKFDKPKIDYGKIGEQLWRKIAEKLVNKSPSLILDKAKEGVEKLITEPLKSIKDKL